MAGGKGKKGDGKKGSKGGKHRAKSGMLVTMLASAAVGASGHRFAGAAIDFERFAGFSNNYEMMFGIADTGCTQSIAGRM